MSLRNFYQTFYQTEQLFRLENDPFMAIATPAAVTEALLVDAEPAETSQLTSPTPTLEMPATPPAEELPVEEAVLVGPEPEPAAARVPERAAVEQPVPLEAAPVRMAPSTHRPGEPDRPDAIRPQLNHKVLILVDEELLPSDVLFLEKILNAINLNVKGVDLLNVHGLEGVDFEPILADKVIHHFLTFGVPFQRLNLDILMDRYQPVRFHGITFMMADPLAAIEGDKVLKKRLWEALKRIFLMG